jgi:hypothetical protein
MALFDTDPQHRENQTILRLFETYVLTTALSQGTPWCWYAVNIPMDLVSPGMKGDIDILACLLSWRSPEESDKKMYRAWEVKVSTVDKNGQARSLKSGKIKNILKQLGNLRRFGVPLVSLLDLYILEDGFFERCEFPPAKIREVMKEKFAKLSAEQFGYQVLPFQHSSVGSEDLGLQTILPPDTWGNRPGMYLLNPSETKMTKAFSGLAKKIDDFYLQSVADHENQHPMAVITYCKKCKKLIRLSPKNTTCPNCGAAFASPAPISFEHISHAEIYDPPPPAGWKPTKTSLLPRVRSFFSRKVASGVLFFPLWTKRK